MLLFIIIFVYNIFEIYIIEVYRCLEFGRWIKISFVFWRKFNIGKKIFYSWYYGRDCIKIIIGIKMFFISYKRVDEKLMLNELDK